MNEKDMILRGLKMLLNGSQIIEEQMLSIGDHERWCFIVQDISALVRSIEIVNKHFPAYKEVNVEVQR
jgi:hypothetical protein